MALAATEHPTPVHLLADAVDLVRAAARRRPRPEDPATAASLRLLLVDLVAAADRVDRTILRAAPGPAPVAVVPGADPGGGPAGRPGCLRLTSTADEVHLTGRGPAPEGDLVRSALLHRAGGAVPSSPSQEALGEVLWTALVAVARDGLEPPTALPTPLGLVGRTG